jgi:hypothetical protein
MGAEAVFEGVGSGASFAFGGARAGGVLGIGSVCSELGLGERRAIGRSYGAFHGLIFRWVVGQFLGYLGKVLRAKEIELRDFCGRLMIGFSLD